jgi:hypothetical protein
LTKSERQIRRNRELAARRKPYVFAVVLLLIALAGGWGWYRFVAIKPRETMNLQYERPERPLVPRLLDNDELLLIRNRDVALIDLRSGDTLWEKPFGSVTNYEDNLPIFSEVTSRVDRPVPEVRVTSNSFWVVWPDHVLNLDRQLGTPLVSIKLREEQETDIFVGDRLLLLEKTLPPTNQLAFEAFPLAGGERQPFEVARPPKDAELAVIPDGDTVVALHTRVLEHRVLTNKVSTSPRVMTASGIEKEVDKNFDKVLNENLTAGNSLNATMQLVEQINRRDGPAEPDETYEDQSLYEVELRRVFGGSSTWKGQITGTPVYFPLPTVDVIVGDRDFKVIDKSGASKWEGTLSYPLSYQAVLSATYHRPSFARFSNQFTYDDRTGTRYLFPFVEHQGTLFAYDAGVLAAFDLASGDVKWRVTSVGIRKITFDHQGLLYACSTLESPQSIGQSSLDRRREPVQVILKIDPGSGRILWQAEHLGTDLLVAGKFLYSQWVGENVLTAAAAMAGNAEATPSCALTRIDPRSGEVIWRREYQAEPDVLNVRGTRVLLQFPRRIEMLKFFSL